MDGKVFDADGNFVAEYVNTEDGPALIREEPFTKLELSMEEILNLVDSLSFFGPFPTLPS